MGNGDAEHTGSTPGTELEPEDRLQWLELFFDLVVIAAIALLSHALREQQTWAGLGMFLLSYGAIWMTWINVVLYADVAGEKTRVPTVLACMLLIATMAAANPAHHETRANAFAGAFLIARALLARTANRTGRMLSSWPLLQFGGFATPWVVAFWVPAPQKYWLWALAVVVDLFLVMRGGDASAQARFEQYQHRFQQRIDHFRARHAGNPDRLARADERLAQLPELVAVDVDAGHLDERLGLLIIVVLGEAVTQLVGTASSTDWTRPFVAVALAGFLVLVGLWALAFAFGFTAAPGARLGTMPPRFGLPLHLLMTLGLLLLAAGLGEFATDPARTPHGLALWLICGGLALHFGVGLAAGLAAGASPRWLLGYAAPSTALPLLLGAIAPLLGARGFAWLLVVPVAWQLFFARRVLRPLGAG